MGDNSLRLVWQVAIHLYSWSQRASGYTYKLRPQKLDPSCCWHAEQQ